MWIVVPISPVHAMTIQTSYEMELVIILNTDYTTHAIYLSWVHITHEFKLP